MEEDPWRELLSKNIDEVAGEDIRKKVISKTTQPSSTFTKEEIINWTRETMDKLDSIVNEEKRNEILTRCAHIIPDSQIQPLREIYEKNKDIDEIHSLLQKQFLVNLKKWFEMKDEWMEIILKDHWGEAGFKDGNIIYTTKIPADMSGYFEAKDETEKKFCYCHCPRVREAIKNPTIKISSTYCYCGAGFYKSTWERILQKPVKVKLLKSIFDGDNICKFSLHLPENI